MRGGSFLAQEARSEGNVYLEPRAPGTVSSVYSIQNVYGIQSCPKVRGAWDCLGDMEAAQVAGHPRLSRRVYGCSECDHVPPSYLSVHRDHTHRAAPGSRQRLSNLRSQGVLTSDCKISRKRL